MSLFKTGALASVIAMSLFSCHKEVNNNLSSSDLTSPTKPTPISSEKAVSVVWGVGSSDRVFRWNAGTLSWDEPNPAARLRTISVGQDNSGAVWGIGSTNRVYKWNPGTNGWDEPNSAFRLTQITAFSANVVWGVGTTNSAIYRSTDGGVSWNSINKSGIPFYFGAQNVTSITTMNGNSAFVTTQENKAYKYIGTGWQVASPLSSQPSLDAISGDANWVCWGVGGAPGYNVYRYSGGSVWNQPSPAAGLLTVSTSDEEIVWGSGPDGRVYRWNSVTSGWDEPNPAARLSKVSSGN